MIFNADNGKYRFQTVHYPQGAADFISNFHGVWSPIHKFIYRYPKKIEFCYSFNWGVVNFKLRNSTISHDFLVVVKNHEFRFICI